MVVIDIMLIASLIAALFFTITSVILQKFFSIYTNILPASYGIPLHIAFLILSWAQVAAVSIFVAKSSWQMSQIVPLGLLLIGISIWLLGSAIKELGFGSLFHLSLFKSRIRKPGRMYKRFKHPLYIGVVTLYAGLGFLTGSKGYFTAVPVIVIGSILLIFAEQPVKYPASTKH